MKYKQPHLNRANLSGRQPKLPHNSSTKDKIQAPHLSPITLHTAFLSLTQHYPHPLLPNLPQILHTSPRIIQTRTKILQPPKSPDPNTMRVLTCPLAFRLWSELHLPGYQCAHRDSGGAVYIEKCDFLLPCSSQCRVTALTWNWDIARSAFLVDYYGRRGFAFELAMHSHGWKRIDWEG